MNSKIITIWDIWNFRDRCIEFNHISDGYDPEEPEPIPNSPGQSAAWAGRGWHPRAAMLNDGVVVEWPCSVPQRDSKP